MAKDTFWFSHDYNSRSDRKMLKLRMKLGMEGVGIYWSIVEMLYEESGFLLRSDYERISYELQSAIKVVTDVIEKYDLFDMNDEKFWSNSALSRLNVRKDKSEKAREAINIRWERERLNKKDTNV